MDKSVYDNLENEVKKNKYFGRDGLYADIALIVFSILSYFNAILIIEYKVIGWSIFGIIALLFIFSVLLSPDIVVYKFFKNEENRKALENIILEKSNTDKKARNILKHFDFSKAIKWYQIININNTTYLNKIIYTLCPTLLEIIKNNGINSNLALKEAIEHYRYKVGSTKKINFSILPIISIVFTIATSIFQGWSKTLFIVLFITIIVVIVYITIKVIAFSMFYKYSRKEFYKNMEQALSDIYISNKLEDNENTINIESVEN